MRRTTRIAVAGLVAVMGVACATDDPHRKAKTGAAIGAVSGAVIGHQIHSKNGRYFGAAVGALTGAAVGNYMDKQQRSMEQKLAAERSDNEIRVTRIDDETLKLELSSEASFDVNSASVKSSFQNSLNKVGTVIAEYDQTAVHIIGYTDSTGSENYNLQLSQKRARAVQQYLNGQSVDRRRMRTAGRGETQPVADNSTASGRSQNRRVEIYLKPFVEGRENEAYRTPS